MFLDLPRVPLPGPRRLSKFGARASVLRLFADSVAAVDVLHESYGDLVAVSRDDPAWICAFGPEHNRAVLSKTDLFQGFTENPLRGPPGSPANYIDDNLISQNGERYRRNRRLMMSAFGKARLRDYGERIIELATRRISAWSVPGTLDIRHEMFELATEIAIVCLCGLEPNAEGREVGALSMRFMERVLSPLAILFQVRLPGTPYADYLDICERLDHRLRELIERRRTTGLGNDVLSALIAGDDEGHRFSETELISQTAMLMVAGHETTAVSLCWIALMLATHPDIQRALASEVMDVLGERAPTLEDLERMPLLRHTVREALRLLPAAPVLFRRAATDFELGGHQLPAGATLLVSPYRTHRDAQLYPEPRRFMPQRWDTLQVGPYQYLPFGAGSRRCIGAGLAEQAQHFTTALILQRARLVIATPTRVDYKVRGIVMGPKRALRLELRRPEDGVAKPARLTGTIQRLVDFDG